MQVHSNVAVYGSLEAAQQAIKTQGIFNADDEQNHYCMGVAPIQEFD